MSAAPRIDRRLGRAGSALALAVGLLVSTSPASSAADVPVKDLGRFIINAGTGGPFVGTVHAVQVTGEATVVYFSVGSRRERALLDKAGENDFIGFGQPSDPDPAAPADASLRLLRVIDPAGKKVYRTLSTAKNPVCVCTPFTGLPEWDATTELLTVAAVLPKLPDEVTSVDVDVNGKGAVVTGIPVTRGGALTPTTGSGGPVIMGSGWPRVDLADAATVADPSPFITDLIAVSESTDNAQRQQETATETEISVSSDVLFDVDQAILTPAAQEQLARVAAQITERAHGPVTVVGHADSDGSDAHNLDLSKRRAHAVVQALTALTPGTQFVADGKGETEPVAPNDTAINKALNRRVTISFATKGGQ